MRQKKHKRQKYRQNPQEPKLERGCDEAEVSKDTPQSKGIAYASKF